MYGDSIIESLDQALKAWKAGTKDYRLLLHITGLLSWASIISRGRARDLAYINSYIDPGIRANRRLHDTKAPQELQKFLDSKSGDDYIECYKKFKMHPYLFKETYHVYVDASTESAFFGFANQT